MKIFSNSRKGQTIVESVVAIGVLLMGFIGVLTLLNNSISTNRVLSDNYTATYLASEGIEIMKDLVQRSAAVNEYLPPGTYNREVEFTNDCTLLDPGGCLALDNNTPLYFNRSTKMYSYSNFGTDSVPTSFIRHVEVTVPSVNEEFGVSSTVEWKGRGGQTYSVGLEDHFFIHH